MKTNTIRKSIVLLILALALYSQAGANENPKLSTIFMKNNSKGTMHIWVGDNYQGSVGSGETRYSVSDGFITNGSDRKSSSGDKTPIKESHAGWAPKPSMLVYFELVAGEKKTSGQIEVYPDQQGRGFIWADFESPGLAITEIQAENSNQILIGRKNKNAKIPKVKWIKIDDLKGEYKATPQAAFTSKRQLFLVTRFEGSAKISAQGAFSGFSKYVRDGELTNIKFNLKLDLTTASFCSFPYTGDDDIPMMKAYFRTTGSYTVTDNEVYTSKAKGLSLRFDNKNRIIIQDTVMEYKKKS